MSILFSLDRLPGASPLQSSCQFVSFAILIERIEDQNFIVLEFLKMFNVFIENGLIMMIKADQMGENWSKNRF